MIYMVGCCYEDNGHWRFRQFTVDRLTADEEQRIVDEWIAFMSGFEASGNAVVYHWSHAETSFLDDADNSARNRNPEKAWPWLNWFDLLKNVFSAEPVAVKGAFGLGLKAVAQAMKSHGLIETDWGDSLVDGLGAMVAAWRIDEEAARDGKRLMDYDLMRDVGRYNEVDCKVMWEILRYLREKH